jgi:transmembrane sensor
MEKSLIERFITNNCTDEEIDNMAEWFRDQKDKPEYAKVFKGIWERENSGDLIISSDYERILDGIHHDINLSGSESIKHSNAPSENRRKIIYRRISVFSRIASVLFIPLLIFSLYTILNRDGSIISENSQGVDMYTEVRSPMGSITSLDLPDGSKVWLNHGSSLRFPQRFTGETREVKLTGEGYFEITPDKQKPFVVDAGEIQALVKGTEFNIMAYPEEGAIETTLASGKLVLQKGTSQKRDKQLLELNPNHHVSYIREEQKFVSSTVNPAKYISWKNGRLVFIDDSFPDIAKKLSRWYNVDIQLKDKELSQYTYTATFIDETLTQVLELLEIATPIKYSISEREKLPDESFTKRKVIIQNVGI